MKKISFGFKEFSSTPTSNYIGSPKEKEKHTRNSNVMYQKSNSAHKNKITHNHVFRYGYNYRALKKYNNHQRITEIPSIQMV
jgi:hypothetical protein